ncbi:hypothetical protein SOVF_125850 [Spinacia oleracea]|nr:hypothetical protein SOVF_125850 [Spinacia oleracea]
MSVFLLHTFDHSFLLTSGIDNLVIVGIQTPNCIRQTVFDVIELDYPSVSVIVDATTTKTLKAHAGTGIPKKPQLMFKHKLTS